MAKDKIAYVCSNCGQESTKWIGKCPGCGQWKTGFADRRTWKSHPDGSVHCGNCPCGMCTARGYETTEKNGKQKVTSEEGLSHQKPRHPFALCEKSGLLAGFHTLEKAATLIT